jgi:hypothetical protein
MKISLIMEGKTEKVFLPHLRAFLQTRLTGPMPKLDPVLYVKTRDADRILRGQDLLVAAKACGELKAFLNTILKLCDGYTAMIP